MLFLVSSPPPPSANSTVPPAPLAAVEGILPSIFRNIYVNLTFSYVAAPPQLPDSPTNPFSGRAPLPRRPQTSSDGEAFPDPSSASASESEQSVPSSPQIRAPNIRSAGGPSAEQASTASRTTGNEQSHQQSRTAAPVDAPQKTRKGAKDVWTFFESTENGRYCKFCQ